MKYCLFTLLAGGLLLFSSCNNKGENYDRIIRNGIVYDGSGAPGIRADIGIRNDTIAFIGDLSGASATEETDAAGQALAPGFIDTHSHHAGNPFSHRDFTAVLSQGITSIIIGQDGGSNFPLASFYQQLTDTPVAVNIGSYSGHNTIRDSILGKDFKRAASAAETEKMKTLLLQDMEAGALGLSTGLEYDPGIYSAREEVLALTKIIAPYNGRYISHIRSEDRYFWNAIDEIINVGKTTGVPVQVSHIKLAMHNLWGKADSLLAIMDQARKEGVQITSDIYPYAFWHSTIRVLFPDRNFSNEKEADMILRDITLPEDIILAAYEINPAYEGKTLAAIAALENKTPARMLVELIARIEAWEKSHNDECRESIMATSMAETDITRLMQWPYANICSDGSSSGRHPRGHGAFPRVLAKYTREEKALTLAQAIYKMTGLAATNLAIEKRGFLRTGYFADIVLFNPDKVKDLATVEEPHALSEGILQVWVNGQSVYLTKKHSGLFPGQLIKRK